MITETINTVLAAENRAEQIKTEAEQKAAQIRDDAEKSAREIAEKASSSAKAESAAAVFEARKKANESYDLAMEESKREGEQLAATYSDKVESLANELFGRITDGNC